MANQTILRISKEIRDIQNGNDLSICVAFQDENIKNVKAMILGPPGSPYEYGFFEFDVRFSSEYPSKPPKVEARTTNSGRTRFNPNIYAGGKVCLSILGTWQGELPGEEWSSAHGLESVLWSIQSLMNDEPYGNEPGYENREGAEDKKYNTQYCAKIRHETLRIAVIAKIETMLQIQADGTAIVSAEKDMSSDDEETSAGGSSEKTVDRQNWTPFNDWQKRRLLWYYESYLNTIEAQAAEHKDGEPFVEMPFEGHGNRMAGSFEYTSLRKRLERCKAMLDQETAGWATDGQAAKDRESNRSYAMASQFNVVKHNLGMSNVEVALENGNPFVWILTYFGKQETNLEGGAWKVKISISTRFPDEQPRVKVLTPISHHRVAKDGTLCYFPRKLEDMKNHVQQMVASLEERSPPYDPRTVVQPELSKLLFGSADDKKRYNRLQRRSAEASMDFEG